MIRRWAVLDFTPSLGTLDGSLEGVQGEFSNNLLSDPCGRSRNLGRRKIDSQVFVSESGSHIRHPNCKSEFLACHESSWENREVISEQLRKFLLAGSRGVKVIISWWACVCPNVWQISFPSHESSRVFVSFNNFAAVSLRFLLLELSHDL
jgi:hypothetical protein